MGKAKKAYTDFNREGPQVPMNLRIGSDIFFIRDGNEQHGVVVKDYGDDIIAKLDDGSEIQVYKEEMDGWED